MAYRSALGTALGSYGRTPRPRVPGARYGVGQTSKTRGIGSLAGQRASGAFRDPYGDWARSQASTRFTSGGARRRTPGGKPGSDEIWNNVG